MNFKLKQAVLGVLTLTALGACEDFLIAPPQGSLDENTLANAAGVEATLIGTYRVIGGMNGQSSAPSNWVYGSVASDDAYKGTEVSDFADINPVEAYNWAAPGSHNVLNNKWSTIYEGVSRANSTLRLLDKVQKDAPGAVTDAAAKGIRGEALFLRAYFHFEAWRMWNKAPVYTEADDDYRKANADADPIPAIIKDLDEAITLLGTGPRNGQKARVTQWTAKAFKGRVQVHAGNYQGGLTTLRDVVNNGPYALEENFHRVWTGFAEFANGKETIFAYQASVNDGEPNGGNGNDAERLNFPHSGSPFGCCGFHQPSQNLVNFFRVDAAGLPLAITSGDLTPLTATSSWNANNANFTAANMAPVDPRLDWTVGRDGVPYKDWGIHNSVTGWVRDISYGGFYNAKKNVQEKASGSQSNVGWNSQHLNGVNIHILRFADVLLLLAEAEVEAGGAAGLENARQLVNRVRRRAGMAAQGPGTTAANIAVPINDPSITWADYRIAEYPSFPNQTYARTAVRYERRLELAMEGQRLFDLQRWNVYQPVLNDYIQVEKNRRPHLTAALAVTERHRWFPIPNRQIELSVVGEESRLTQNPGW